MTIRPATFMGILTLFFVPQARTDAAWHRQWPRVRCCLPQEQYAKDRPRTAGTLLAAADSAQEVDWLEDHVPRPREGNLGADVKWRLHKKEFHFPARSLTVDTIRLEQVGLAIYDTGMIQCTGKVTHTGGPDGSLRSNEFVIQLRAYAAPADGAAELMDAPVVWESAERRMRVRKGETLSISLAPQGSLHDPALRRYFNYITHLEVELAVPRDR